MRRTDERGYEEQRGKRTMQNLQGLTIVITHQFAILVPGYAVSQENLRASERGQRDNQRVLDVDVEDQL